MPCEACKTTSTTKPGEDAISNQRKTAVALEIAMKVRRSSLCSNLRKAKNISTSVKAPMAISQLMALASSPSQMPIDGRQSQTALAVARGTARLLHAHGRCVVSELPLPSGRRADLVALDPSGEIWIIEIKSSIADFRADQKWHDYRAHCDRLFFAWRSVAM